MFLGLYAQYNIVPSSKYTLSSLNTPGDSSGRAIDSETKMSSVKPCSSTMTAILESGSHAGHLLGRFGSVLASHCCTTPRLKALLVQENIYLIFRDT